MTNRSAMPLALIVALMVPTGLETLARADSPVAMYIFPAGGQRGASVKFRVGGLYLHESCPFEMQGAGITASAKIDSVETVWFEGPVIPLPDSQQAEDYPRDLAGTLTIAGDAQPGTRTWRVWTDQGAAPSRPFVVGDLPEIVEEEIDGTAIPVPISLPVTVNGRIFPREDVDLWSFPAKTGETITCTAQTSRLGSPFDARLEIRNEQGTRIAESSDVAPLGIDALVHFTAPADGTYTVAIHDLKFGGLQHYVYRLTVTAGAVVDHAFPLGGRRGTTTKFKLSGSNVPAGTVDLALPAAGPSRWTTTFGLPTHTGRQLALELDDLPEIVEQEPNETREQAVAVDMPVVCNGRIGQPGDVDYWCIRGTKGQTWDVDLRAARLGSPLDSVISIYDGQGKELARADDTLLTDSYLRFTVPDDGPYYVKVEDRLRSRGSPAFGYRLRIAPPAGPDFSLQVVSDALTVNRGGEVKYKIKALRTGTFAEPITLEFENLPAGLSVANPVIPGNAAEIDVTLKAEAAAPIGAKAVRIRGTATIAGNAVVRPASFVSTTRDEITSDTVLMAVAQPTPFKVKGVYEVKYAQRGGKFVRHFTVDRGGYNGPLQVRLADKQTRHLQGVRGPTIDVPAGASEFDYPVFLPPWMEIGRTSRTVVMAVGEIADPDGTRHKVSFTSLQQNEQIVALIDPGQLSVDLDRQSVVAVPGEFLDLEIQVGRGQGVNVPVRVELIAASHIHGVTADPIVVATDQKRGTIRIQFARAPLGPFNMPLTIRATAMKGENDPVVAEAGLEVVPAE